MFLGRLTWATLVTLTQTVAEHPRLLDEQVSTHVCNNHNKDNHLDLLYGKLMRGVTSSSVATADWRQLANSSAAARRQWTAADVHMVAGSSQTDIHKCLFVCFFVSKIPWFS